MASAALGTHPAGVYQRGVCLRDLQRPLRLHARPRAAGPPPRGGLCLQPGGPHPRVAGRRRPPPAASTTGGFPGQVRAAMTRCWPSGRRRSHRSGRRLRCRRSGPGGRVRAVQVDDHRVQALAEAVTKGVAPGHEQHGLAVDHEVGVGNRDVRADDPVLDHHPLGAAAHGDKQDAVVDAIGAGALVVDDLAAERRPRGAVVTAGRRGRWRATQQLLKWGLPSLLD
jgi:hypothetical protein